MGGVNRTDATDPALGHEIPSLVSHAAPQTKPSDISPKSFKPESTATRATRATRTAPVDAAKRGSGVARARGSARTRAKAARPSRMVGAAQPAAAQGVAEDATEPDLELDGGSPEPSVALSGNSSLPSDLASDFRSDSTSGLRFDPPSGSAPASPVEVIAEMAGAAAAAGATAAASAAGVDQRANEDAAFTAYETPSEFLPETPTDPLLETLSGPLLEKPSGRQLETPSDPLLESQSEPLLETPSDPLPQIPSDHLIDTPSDRLLETPSDHLLKTPSTSAVETPSASVIETPSAPVSEIPLASDIEAPPGSVIEFPSASVIETLSEPLLERPSEPLFENPSPPSLETPSEPSLETKAGSRPESHPNEDPYRPPETTTFHKGTESIRDHPNDSFINNFADQDDRGSEAATKESIYKVFLGRLSPETRSDDLRDHFSQYGSVAEAVVISARETGRSRGFGFCSFVEGSAMDQALKDEHTICGAKIDIKVALSKDHKSANPPPPDGGSRVFVGGLRDDVTELELRQYFEQYGTLASVSLLYDRDGSRNRGYGFVLFKRAADAGSSLGAHRSLGPRCEAKTAHPQNRSGRIPRDHPEESMNSRHRGAEYYPQTAMPISRAVPYGYYMPPQYYSMPMSGAPYGNYAPPSYGNGGWNGGPNRSQGSNRRGKGAPRQSPY